MVLNAQLNVLKTLAVDEKVKTVIQLMMNALEWRASIAAVRAHMALIHAVVSDDWWHDVTPYQQMEKPPSGDFDFKKLY